METTILVRAIHFISIFLVIASVFAELLIVQPKLKRAQILFLSKIDGLYGISSILVLGAGFLLWFVVGKSPEFYAGNHIFYTKIGLFSVVGLLSLYPTIFFFKNRKGDPEEEITIPKNIKTVIIIEFCILLIIPFLASAMAAGIGR